VLEFETDDLVGIEVDSETLLLLYPFNLQVVYIHITKNILKNYIQENYLPEVGRYKLGNEGKEAREGTSGLDC
jgi:hypothetical protein